MASFGSHSEKSLPLPTTWEASSTASRADEGENRDHTECRVLAIQLEHV